MVKTHPVFHSALEWLGQRGALFPAEMILDSKSPDTITFAGVATIIITSGLAYLGGILTSRAQTKLERDKWLRARQDDVRRDIRAAVASLVSALAAFAHSIMWFTYNASSWAGPPP